jgi:nitrogen fixation protein NifX
MLKIAFASNDRTTVNLHFGGAESLVLYDVSPGRADLLGVGEFIKSENLGDAVRKGLTDTVQDKVLAKLDFLKDCHAVYAASIGVSSIRRLMGQGIQPIIVEPGHEIMDLLNEVSLGLVYGGLAWIEKAKAKVEAAGVTATPMSEITGDSQRLIASVDEL